MRWLLIAAARIRALFRRDAITDEIREEMDFHLDMRAGEYARGGLPRREARREAARRFGNVAVLRDRGYDVRGGGVLESIWQDIRYGVRSLRQSRTFTAVALTVLALAIGAGTAIFSVVDAVFLRGLPYDEHDRIVAVLGVDTQHATTFGNGASTTQTYLDWRRLQASFEGIALTGPTSFQLKSPTGEPDIVRGQQVTSEFFAVLRGRPVLGRTFTVDDEVEGQERVVVMSHGFWQRRFGGAPEVIDQTIEINGQPWRIVGVMPRDFSYPPGADQSTELYAPQPFRSLDKIRGGSHNYNGIVIGRLKPGVSLTRAQEQMNRVAEALDAQFPKWEPGWRVRVVTLQEHLVGKTRNWMLLLLGAVGLVLLIACANVANLMLARASARTREIGVRTALGAGRWRIVRALLIESLMLSLAGGLIGVALAYGGVQVLRAWLPPDVPRVASIAIDWRVLGTTMGAAIATGLLFGLAPAIQAARPNLAMALKDGDRASTSSPASRRLRNGLVVSELAVAVPLLFGAGLFVTSFINLMRVEPGFDYRNTLSIGVALRRTPADRADMPAWLKRGAAHVTDVAEAIRRVPGVTGVTAVSGGSPLTGSWSRPGLTLPGRGEVGGEDAVDLRRITPNYFAQLKIPLLRGRAFSDDDRADGPLVVVVNEAAARKYWPGRDPVGEHVKIQDRDRVVVGVVGDIRQYGPETPTRQCAFVPFAQEPSNGAELLIRTSGDPMKMLPAIKTVIWSINRDQILRPENLSLEGYLDRLIATRRFNMALLTILGFMGLVIAAVGIFGVMAYTVAQRTSEIGLRMALGASPGQITMMVLKGATMLVAIGLALGAAAAWYLSPVARDFLFQIQPLDARIFAAALALLGLVGLCAAAIPARRAARVDPLRSLRES